MQTKFSLFARLDRTQALADIGIVEVELWIAAVVYYARRYAETLAPDIEIYCSATWSPSLCGRGLIAPATADSSRR